MQSDGMWRTGFATGDRPPLANGNSEIQNCRSWLASDGGQTADHNLTVTPRSNCRSWLASDGGTTADHNLTVTPRSNCRSWLASDGGPTADHNLTVTPQSKCGSWLACEGGLTADLDVGSDRVHIRYLGNGCYGFRPYGGSLLNSAKVSKTLLPQHSAPRSRSVCP